MIPFSLQTGTHTSILIPSIKCFGCFFFTFSFPLFFFIIYSFILCLIFKYFRSGDTCVWIPWFNHIFICSLVVFPFVNAEIKKKIKEKNIKMIQKTSRSVFGICQTRPIILQVYNFSVWEVFLFFSFLIEKENPQKYHASW